MSNFYEAEITGSFTAKTSVWADTPEEALEELQLTHVTPDESELSDIEYDYDIETLGSSDLKKIG